MIIIDASVVYDSFDDNRLLRQIIEAPQAIKAPKLIIREILGLRGQIEKDYNLSHKQFDFIWKTLSQKTNIEDVNQFDRSQAEKIITELNLDINDVDYIALYLRYLSNKPTLWTYDTPFVFGDKANQLRKKYKIFANFPIRPK